MQDKPDGGTKYHITTVAAVYLLVVAATISAAGHWEIGITLLIFGVVEVFKDAPPFKDSQGLMLLVMAGITIIALGIHNAH